MRYHPCKNLTNSNAIHCATTSNNNNLPPKKSKHHRPVPPPPPPVVPPGGGVTETKLSTTFQAHQRELEKLDEILMANDGGTEDESVDITR